MYNKRTVISLIILITLDFITTLIAVGYCGATEINPIVNIGFTEFMTVKLIISVCAISILSTTEVPNEWIYSPVLIYYGVVVSLNLYQLCWLFCGI